MNQLIKSFLRPVANKLGLTIKSKHAGGYISVQETLAAAQEAGLSINDYLDRLWAWKRGATRVFDRIEAAFPANSIVEIGAGSGCFTEEVLKRCSPRKYQIYETAPDWREYLKSYPVEICKTDGETLCSTRSASVDLLHAHSVFIYLPFLVSCSYLREIRRVLSPGGFAAFNIITEDCMTPEIIDRWLSSEHRFPQILSKEFVKKTLGFHLVDSWNMKCGEGSCEYLFFRADQDRVASV